MPRLVVIHLRGSISVVKTCIDATQNAGLMENPEIFLTYVSRAEREYGSNEAITRDTKRHMQKIRKTLDGKKKR